MAPVVVRSQARVRSQASPSEICGRQSGTETGFSPSTSISPVGIIPPMLRIHLRLNIIGRNTGNFTQTTPLRPWEGMGCEVFRLQRVATLSKFTNICGNKTMQLILSSDVYTKTFKTPVSLPCIAKLMIRQDTQHAMWKEMFMALPFSKLKTKAGSIILKCIARKKKYIYNYGNKIKLSDFRDDSD